jgi:hypothetical protein
MSFPLSRHTGMGWVSPAPSDQLSRLPGSITHSSSPGLELGACCSLSHALAESWWLCCSGSQKQPAPMAMRLVPVRACCGGPAPVAAHHLGPKVLRESFEIQVGAALPTPVHFAHSWRWLCTDTCAIHCLCLLERQPGRT